MDNYDILIQNAKVIDGTGREAFKGFIGIKGDKIVKVGKIDPDIKSPKTIDAQDMMICPGFIDMHGHSDLNVLIDLLCKSKVYQGVTTEVIGNCGASSAPINEERIEDIKNIYSFLANADLEWDWRSYNDYLEKVEKMGPSMNIAPLVGQGTVRIAAMGFEDRNPNKKEMAWMQDLVREAMEEGAFGMSTGLIYPPGSYSSTEEIIELCKVVAEYNGIYCSHVRGESDYLLEAISEAIKIGKEAGLGVQISHHKAAGKENWGKVEKSIGLIGESRSEGLDVTSDQYPYRAGSTGLSFLLPGWVHEGGVKKLLKRIKDPETAKRIKRDIQENRVEGWWNPLKSSGWDKVLVVGIQSEKNRKFEGKTLAEIAKDTNKDPYQSLFDLLCEEEAKVRMIVFMMDEKDVITVLKHSTTMIGTDGSARSPEGILGRGKTHPRAYGTYPRILGRYVREENVLPLNEAIKKMTSLPAQKLGLKDRGLVREGYKADLVVFDPDLVADTATYTDLHQYPQGIEYVLVNGQFVLSNGEHTGHTPGQLLRRMEE